MKKVLLLFVLFGGCKNHSVQTTLQEVDNSKVQIFKASEQGIIFSLKINNDFYYHDSMLVKDVPIGFLIGQYPKSDDSVFIQLRINDRDTSFKYLFKNIDSLLVGKGCCGGFYIVTNKQRDAWALD